MKATKTANDTLIFVTNTGEMEDPNEFMIEIYPYTPDLLLDDQPQFIIHNFDELIDFFDKE